MINQDSYSNFSSILIAEDEDDHARIISRSLKESAAIANEIIRVVNGQEAINYLKKEGKYKNLNHSLPILVLLDVKMPLKDGFEVLQEIKEDEKLKNIPVVMLTTTSTRDDLEKALKLGANDYIVKPLKLKDFMNKVSKLGCYWGLVSDVKLLLP